jgi:sec-independent protein translocase protein TatA
MLGMGPWELVLIFAIVLLLFGGKRLPSIATGLGTAIRNFKVALNEPVESEKLRSIESNGVETQKIHSGNSPQA